MPRNAAGNYTLPNPPVLAGTTILDTDENTTRDDLAVEITNSLDRNGRGGMLAPFRISDGAMATPGIAFLSTPNTGMYQPATNVIGFSANGADVLRLNSVPLSENYFAMGSSASGQPLTVTAIGPGPNVAINIVPKGSGAVNVVGSLAVSGTISGTFSGVMTGTFGDGTALLPSITFTSDPNTGFWRPGADILAVSTAGSERLRFGATGDLAFATPTWAFNSSNLLMSRNPGTVPGGSAEAFTLTDSNVTGDAGGTSSPRNLTLNLTTIGANAFASAFGIVNRVNHSGSNTMGTLQGYQSTVTHNSAALVSTAVGYVASFSLTSTGGISALNYFSTSVPTITGAGVIVGATGLSITNIGHAQVTLVNGINVADQTGSPTARGILLNLSAGAGKNNLYINGTATSIIVGNVRIGSTVEPTNALDVTGSLTVSQNATLGDAAADVLTINAGTWTLGSNYVATRAVGALIAGSQNIQTWNTTFSGDAGGTSDVRVHSYTATLQGANPMAAVRLFRNTLTINNTAGTVAQAIFEQSNIATNAAPITLAQIFDGFFSVAGVGNIGTALVFNAGAPAMTSTGIVTTYVGFAVGNIGHAQVTNAIGVSINDITASPTVRGLQSAVSSGASKHNLYIFGTAPNYLQGNVLLGTASDIFGSPLQINSTTGTSALDMARWSADANGYVLRMEKSRGAAIGTHALVAANDQLGNIRGQGSDGTAFRTGAEIAFEVDGTPGANDMPGRIRLFTTPDGTASIVEAMRIDSSQRVTFGGVANQQGSTLELHSATAGKPDIGLLNYNAGSGGPSMSFWKSRGPAIGGLAAVQANDLLGAFVFRGSDGAAFQPAVSIRAEVDAAPGAGDMPGRIVFQTTPDGSAALTEAMRIDSAQRVIIGGAANTLAGKLQVVSAVSNEPSIGMGNWTNDANNGILGLFKSRGGTVGVNAATQANDALGIIRAHGNTGAIFSLAAQIAFMADGPGTPTSMPGRIEFYTVPSGSLGAVLNMVIKPPNVDISGNGTSITTLAVNDTGNPAGASIRISGNGAVTPHKYLRVNAGLFEIINSAYTLSAMALTDDGVVTFGGVGPGTGFTGAGSMTLPVAAGVRSRSTFSAWVRHDAAGNIIRAFNVTSVTKNSTGNYTANIAAGVMADGNYGFMFGACTVTGPGAGAIFQDTVTPPTATAFRYQSVVIAGTATASDPLASIFVGILP